MPTPLLDHSTSMFNLLQSSSTGEIVVMERSLIILKPDALQRGLVGEIVTRLERKGLKLIGVKMLKAESALLRAHYAHLVDKPFYKGLEEFMQSSPVIIMVWEGFECINSIRTLVGATNPREADAGTIRGDFSIGQGRNLIHASDSKASAEEEIERFFEKKELFNYDKSEYVHLYDPEERQ